MRGLLGFACLVLFNVLIAVVFDINSSMYTAYCAASGFLYPFLYRKYLA